MGGVVERAAPPPVAAAIVVAGRSSLPCEMASERLSGVDRECGKPIDEGTVPGSDDSPPGCVLAPVEAARLRGGGRSALGSSELSDEYASPTASGSERVRVTPTATRRGEARVHVRGPSVASRACMRPCPAATAGGICEVEVGEVGLPAARGIEDGRAGWASSSAAKRYCDWPGGGRAPGMLTEGRGEGGSKWSMIESRARAKEASEGKEGKRWREAGSWRAPRWGRGSVRGSRKPGRRARLGPGGVGLGRHGAGVCER